MKPYSEALSAFMERKALFMKSGIEVDPELYFKAGDREEILSWNETTSKKIWMKMKQIVANHESAGLRYELCPFCHKNDYDHKATGPKNINPSCVLCGYGKRHGYCTDVKSGKSEYWKILKIFEKDRVDMYRFLSTEYYIDLVKELEAEFKI